MTDLPQSAASPRNESSLPGPLRIYLVRHGETAWSLSGQYTGRTDIPLTTHGKDAARRLGARIRNIPFTRVLTSPLERSRQTCELARLAQPAEIEPDLTEWDHGDYEGRLPADVLKALPGFNLFRDGAPHGETPVEIAIRADRFLSKLRMMAGNVALFSHGHFGRVLAARWIGLTVGQAQHLLLETASLSVLCYERGLTNEPAIALWNSAGHDSFDSQPAPPIRDASSSKQRVIDRWEDEGGELPAVASIPTAVLGGSLPTTIPHQLNRAATTDTRPLAPPRQMA